MPSTISMAINKIAPATPANKSDDPWFPPLVRYVLEYTQAPTPSENNREIRKLDMHVV